MANPNNDDMQTSPESEGDTFRTSHSRRDDLQPSNKKNSKSRTILIVGGVVVFLVIGFGIFSLTRKGPSSSEGGAVPSAPRVTDTPGGSTASSRQRDMQREENEELARKAAEQGKTNLPTLVSDENENGLTLDPFGQTQAPTPTPDAPAQVPVVQAPPVVQQPVVQAPAPTPAPEPERAPPKYSEADYQNKNAAFVTYLQAWQVRPTPSQEFAYNGSKPTNEELAAANGVATGASTTGSTVQNSSVSRTKSASFVRAGTVIPAVLLGSLNSDNPGPILAQITSGPLAGTRVLGQFSASEKALTLTFSTLSKPGLGTYSIKAVAIDDNYATGMATDVNNHYFRRYGLTLAAAFVEGYGDAISRQNTTVTSTDYGTVVSQGELSDSDIAKSAFGEVGSKIGQQLSREGNTVRPTVTLDCGGGCSVGLLFLSDF